jgi:2-haloacid dehalogenase
MKPDRRIYEILLERFGIDPATAVFIDDNPVNAQAATAVGMRGIHFRSAPALRRELAALGLVADETSEAAR